MGGGEAKAPFHQMKSKRCMWPSPTYSTYILYCHAHHLGPLHISPCRPNGACTFTTSSGDQWGYGKYPHLCQVQSCTLWPTSLPHYDPPVYHVCPSIKSWLNKRAVLADRALGLPGRNLACILHKSQVTSRFILNFKNCRRMSRRAAGEERKRLPARGLPLTLDRLVGPWKVYSWAPIYSSISPCHNQ